MILPKGFKKSFSSLPIVLTHFVENVAFCNNQDSKTIYRRFDYKESLKHFIYVLHMGKIF